MKPGKKKIGGVEKGVLVKQKDRSPTSSATSIDLTKENGVTSVNSGSLEELGRKHGMFTCQENGQQIYGPPIDWNGPSPAVGSEVFVGHVPRNVPLVELIKLFGEVGPIFKVRLMMNFSGTNRGFCFVQYVAPEYAERAIDELNNHEIVQGEFIGVKKSVDNRRLLIRNIPADKTSEEIAAEISAITEEVTRVISFPAVGTHLKNCGFAFVEYDSHRSAAVARRKFISERLTMWNRNVSLDWAEPAPPNVRSLLIQNFRPNTSAKRLRREFSRVSDEGVSRVRKFTGFAFIDFKSTDQADYARIALNNTKVDGSVIKILWAKYTPELNSQSAARASRGRYNTKNRGGFVSEEAQFYPMGNPNLYYGQPGVPSPMYEQNPGYPPFPQMPVPMANMSPPFYPMKPVFLYTYRNNA